MFLGDGLAAAANAGFQFSKHLGVPDLPCLLNVCEKREAGRDKLHINAGLKVKDKNAVERKVKTERKGAASGISHNMIDRGIKEICKNVPHTDFPEHS